MVKIKNNKYYLTCKVIINNIADVSEFVKRANAIEDEVTVKKGQYKVDGKSLMGMFTVDTSEMVEVTFPENETEFKDWLEQFIVE